MKKTNLVLLAIIILASIIQFPTSSLAATVAGRDPGDGRFGAGIVLGSPTALTGKYWLTNSNALDFGLSFFIGSNVLFYGDYLWHWPGGFGSKTRFVSQLMPYIGVGAGLFFWSGTVRPWNWPQNTTGVGLYARVPFGIEWYPTTPPLGVFFELVPGIQLIPGMGMLVDAGLGIRYYF